MIQFPSWSGVVASADRIKWDIAGGASEHPAGSLRSPLPPDSGGH